jgi:hypothetical protein
MDKQDHEHDHDHEGHDHEDHGHDRHNHDHDNHEPVNGEVQVNLHEENAMIASGTLTLFGVDAEEISTKLANALAQVAKNVDEAGGMIGHLKATLAKTDIRMLSTTASETAVSVKLSPQSEVVVNIVLIVFMVDSDDLLKWGQGVMAALR